VMNYKDWRDLFWLFVVLGGVFFAGSFLLDGRVLQSCSGLLSALLFVAALGMKPTLKRLKQRDK
jgi:hypothetical protein